MRTDSLLLCYFFFPINSGLRRNYRTFWYEFTIVIFKKIFTFIIPNYDESVMKTVSDCLGRFMNNLHVFFFLFETNLTYLHLSTTKEACRQSCSCWFLCGGSGLSPWRSLCTWKCWETHVDLVKRPQSGNYHLSRWLYNLEPYIILMQLRGTGAREKNCTYKKKIYLY